MEGSHPSKTSRPGSLMGKQPRIQGWVNRVPGAAWALLLKPPTISSLPLPDGAAGSGWLTLPFRRAVPGCSPGRVVCALGATSAKHLWGCVAGWGQRRTAPWSHAVLMWPSPSAPREWPHGPAALGWDGCAGGVIPSLLPVAGARGDPRACRGPALPPEADSPLLLQGGLWELEPPRPGDFSPAGRSGCTGSPPRGSSELDSALTGDEHTWGSGQGGAGPCPHKQEAAGAAVPGASLEPGS